MLASLVITLLALPGQLVPLFPSPPGWNEYVHLIERALDFLASAVHSAGLAVIVFTILIKTALMPLTIQSIRSSKSMQELQPKIKELQKKHGKDRQRLSQETMRLYSEHRVNPAAGCLPMLIQIPIFFGLYRAISQLSQGQIEASTYWKGDFLWLHSVAQQSHFALAEKDPYHILPILAGVFQFVQTKMMRPAGQKVTDPQQAMMNQMMNFMPITVVLFGWGFASGPVIYWVAQSLYSVIQQWFITGWGSMKEWVPGLPELPEHRRLGYRPPRNLDDVVVVTGGEGGAIPRPPGIMGWLQGKIEQAQQQGAARRTAGAAGGRSDLQRQVDVETSRPTPKSPRPMKKGSPAARAANGAAGSQRPDGTGKPPTPSANGQARTNGVAGPRLVPRKSRPPRKDDSPTE